VKEMLNQDCIVLCVDKDKTALGQLEHELLHKYNYPQNHLFFFDTDISCANQITALFTRIQSIAKIARPVDILINNAAIMNEAKLLTELCDAELTAIFNVNILAQMRLCKLFLPEMTRHNRGHIINVASSLGLYGAYKMSDYCATKFAVCGFTEALRVELKTLNARNKVHVSLVCPFHVTTGLFRGFELPRLKWLGTSVTPQMVATQILNGILLEKEIIGIPNYTYFMFAAIKKYFKCASTVLP
jgi:short-subunit dehydrogenase